MLQQTRVHTVIPYYTRWMRRFPSMRSLAAAREQSVLSLWEGLGYYSRARHLHRAARIVVREHGGRLPPDVAALRDLPGVGEYIAAAVSSIAFGSDIAALDANVMRVLARLECIGMPLASADARRRLRLIAAHHLPAGRAGDFNQALMDLGSLVCLPRQPRCGACPLRDVCGARKRGLENRIPVRRKPNPRPHFYARAAIVARGNRVLLVRHGGDGLLGGLWEFPKSSRCKTLPNQAQLIRELQGQALVAGRLQVTSREPLAVVDHTYSHFSITVHAFLCTASVGIQGPGARWVPITRLACYPMGKVDRTVARRLELVSLRPNDG
jgi:A/G-specific adenine glycosylase